MLHCLLTTTHAFLCTCSWTNQGRSLWQPWFLPGWGHFGTGLRGQSQVYDLCWFHQIHLSCSTLNLGAVSVWTCLWNILYSKLGSPRVWKQAVWAAQSFCVLFRAAEWEVTDLCPPPPVRCCVPCQRLALLIWQLELFTSPILSQWSGLA